MLINVQSAVGLGPTELAAFDDALRLAAINNFNLIRLSSVIPPGSVLEVPAVPVRPDGEWGDRLYVVYAEQREARRRVGAWAGVGWVQRPDGSGLLVEHEGESETVVAGLIRSTLTYMTESRGDGDYGPIRQNVVGGTCVGQPICAFVCATFTTEPW
jgi:arginine decarboxylase